MMKSIYISSCVPDGGVWRCGFDGETLTKRDFSPVGRVMYTAREGRHEFSAGLSRAGQSWIPSVVTMQS